MRLINLSVLLLLSVAIKLIAADDDDTCERNKYKNDASLIKKLSGFLYTESTSTAFGSNEIFGFGPIEKGHITVRTTTDNKCCRTMDLDAKPKKNYFEYKITSDKDCPTKLNETARLKLISQNVDDDKSYCLLLWTCRKSREGVHVFCTKSKISPKQTKWIREQYRQLKLKKIDVEHNKDYKNGKCFKKKPF